MLPPIRLISALTIGVLVWPSVGSTQVAPDRCGFRTRLAISGSSDDSDPAGFSIYSGIGLEVALNRAVGREWSVELGLRTESREVDRAITAAGTERLGSLEVLPLTLLVQRRLSPERSIRPYLGVGGNLTVVWEKSGVLDSLDVKPHLGAVVQAGAEVPLTRGALFNVEARWQTLVVEVDGSAGRFARLRVHPLTLGAGLGFRF